VSHVCSVREVVSAFVNLNRFSFSEEPRRRINWSSLCVFMGDILDNAHHDGIVWNDAEEMNAQATVPAGVALFKTHLFQCLEETAIALLR